MERAHLSEIIEDCYLNIATSLYKIALRTEKGDDKNNIKNDLPKVLNQVRETFPPAKLKLWINGGCDFVARIGKCLYAEAYATVSAQAYWIYFWQYAGDIISCYWNGIPLAPKYQEEIDNSTAVDWENAESYDTPKYYIHFPQQKGHGAGHSFKLYPKPKEAGTFKIRVMRLPTPLTNDLDLIALEGVWADAVVNYVVNKAIKDANAMQKLAQQIELMRQEAEFRNKDRVPQIRDVEEIDLWQKK